MKKLITTIIIIILIALIFVFRGMGGYSKGIKSPIVGKEVTQEATSKIVSENGLEDWTITLNPRLGASIQYNGKSTIQDLVIKLSTGTTLKVPTLEPNSAISIQERQSIYLGKVDVNLEWVNEGQRDTGNVIFQINSVK